MTRREIMFRGYCPDAKRWVYGYYLKHEGCPEDDIVGCEAIGVPQKENWVNWYEIDPLTLCQYSGYKDKYGNPLYHGDEVLMLDALDGRRKKDALIIYDDFKGEWILEEKKGGRRGKERYALAPSFIHEQCVKKYGVLNAITMFDDYIKAKWGC